MESSLQPLFPLISRRFQSFAEAADAALDVLSDQVPGEIVIGQIEAGDDKLRVLDGAAPRRSGSSAATCCRWRR